MSISITRALAEIKSISARLEKQIGRFEPVTVGLQHPQSAAAKQEQEQFADKATADFNSIIALLTRRDALKAAIIASNAATTVVIGGQTMTVAEAIERKQSIALKQRLLRQVRETLTCARSTLEERSEGVQRRLDTFISSQEKVLKEPDLLKQATASFLQLNELALLDPIGAQGVVDTLEEEVTTFLTEVDFALSESNARTQIDVD